MLKVINLHAGYGAIKALKGIDVTVGKGEVVALLGANGAGKSTLLKALSGLVKITLGNIHIDSKETTKLKPYSIVKTGVVHVPEGRRVFHGLTVVENLKMGAYTRKNKIEVVQDLERVYSYFPILKERRNQLAGSFSGGQQQMLVIGRALMARPKVLLLDEPSLGLAPKTAYEIFDILCEINRAGVTILMVEQNAHMALSIASRGYVVQNGKIAVSGSSLELRNKDELVNSYLG